MIRLNGNTTQPIGKRSRNAFGVRSKARKLISTIIAPASNESNVASSEKYVCSLFIV